MEKMGGIMIPLILLHPALANFKSSTFVHKVLQTSCDIVITFSIVCCCLFYSMESLMKLTFQRVVIDPKRTPDEEVMVVLLWHYALSRDISERAALKDFTITLHTDLQNSWFLMHWKIDLMEIQNNLLFAHGTSLILDEKLITTVTLWRWWSDRTIFFAGMLHTYCLNKQFSQKH